VNLYESEAGYVLTAELPGLASPDFEISVEGNRVTLRGERKVDYPDDGRTSIHRRERPSGIFRRSVELPAPLDPDKAEAVYRNGVLMLRVPKARSHQPRQITVQTS
jgi:HSP20 family protein